MEKITKELFYSSKEGILFWVAGYTKDRNMTNLKEIIADLNLNGIRFAQHAGCDFDEVNTFYITESPCYKNMRVFFTYLPKNLEDAFELKEDWTMSEWITY